VHGPSDAKRSGSSSGRVTAKKARANKPAGDLLWATAAGGPFTALSTTAVSAGSGAPTAGTIPAFFYRTAYDWTLDTPGAYSLTVVFTLTAP